MKSLKKKKGKKKLKDENKKTVSEKRGETENITVNTYLHAAIGPLLQGVPKGSEIFWPRR